jgi:hypothetical protein
MPLKLLQPDRLTAFQRQLAIQNRYRDQRTGLPIVDEILALVGKPADELVPLLTREAGGLLRGIRHADNLPIPLVELGTHVPGMNRHVSVLSLGETRDLTRDVPN